MFRFIEHPADLAMEVESDSREGLFQDALEALATLLTGTENGHRSNDAPGAPTFEIAAEGEDDEELLVGILNELLFQCQVGRWAPGRVRSVRFQPGRVTVVMSGVEGVGGRGLAREIKAATYHNLQVKSGNRWSAQVVLDV